MKITCVGYLLVMLSVYIAWTNFLSYGDDIVSSCNLKSFVTDNVMFLNDIITDNNYYHAHAYFVKFFVLLLCCYRFGEMNMKVINSLYTRVNRSELN